MANLKELMGMSEAQLHGIGAQYGLNFHSGMKKSQMAQAISANAASGWMEQNAQLMHEVIPEDNTVGYGGDDRSLSDAAMIAMRMSSAGLAETMHHEMSSGEGWHVDAVNSYLEGLGTTVDQVMLHIPRANPDNPVKPWGHLNSYLRDTLSGHEDMMPELAGHYSGDILKEYSTTKGGVKESYDHLAHMYLDKSRYGSDSAYSRDVERVSSRLASQLKYQMIEVAASAAMGLKASYMDLLPEIGDSSVVGNVEHPRQKLNAAGLPMGSTGSAVGNNTGYSLAASVSGSPAWSDSSKAIFGEAKSTIKDLAQTYLGGSETGMNPYRHVTSDRDRLLDEATRSIGIEEARSGYDNLFEPSASRENLEAILNNDYDQMDSVVKGQRVNVSNYSDQAKYNSNSSTGTAFETTIGSPKDLNIARARREHRESIAAANLDSPHVQDAPNPIQYHSALQQGTQEWLDFRQNYDITGSTIGDYLGNNPATNSSPIKAMGEKIGLTTRADTPRQRENFARGHRLEEEARPRVANQFGFDIGQTGAITNEQYPGMMYSPDGLIGDDALWEHKAPNQFKPLSSTPNYIDQMQLGMMLSGRSRTLFTQTVGDESRSEWVDADPDWYKNNRDKIASSMARMNAGRDFMSSHSDLDDKAMIAGTRAAMTGEGIWGFRNASHRDDYYTGGRRGMSKYSPSAGSGNDEFLSSSSAIPAATGSTSVPPTGNVEVDQMALAVKQGILGAQEENKQKAGALSSNIQNPFQEDADFEDAIYSRGNAGGGGGRRGGGGSGGSGGNDDGFDLFGRNAFGRIAGGISSGTLSGTQSGFMDALRNGGPIGQTVALGIGAAGVGGEILSTMSDYRGVAEDSGSTNAIGFDSMNQGMEMLGLNESQARSVSRTTHSAYNNFQNGDPSGAVRIITGSRGLLTMSDINSTQGDPVALARIFRDRAQARGWSQARIAGAADMAGLDGFARTATRGDRTFDASSNLVAQRQAEDVSDFNTDSERGQAVRAAASPTYFTPRYTAEASGAIMSPITETMNSAFPSFDRVMSGGARTLNEASNDMVELVQRLESNNKDFDAHGNPITSPTGAKYSMQVLPSTARDPGYGITPARNDSPVEYNRVGRELLGKMNERYDGDWRKANAAYTDGAGTVDAAVKEHGNDWLSHMPQQAQKRVSDMERAGFGKTGAGGFAGSSISGNTTVVNVNIKAQVNNQTATATVNPYNGETVTQTINMHNNAMQRR